jgi:hypothetical protein
LVLRPKSPNRSRRFWGPNWETITTGFEVKPPETIAAGFEAKPLETVAAGFEAKPSETIAAGFEPKPAESIVAGFEVKPLETVTTGFEAKPAKTVRVVLRPNHSQTVVIGFEAQTDKKSFEWFWGQTIHKPLTLVLRLNQETHAPHLHMHGTDRTWRHSTSRSSGHRVPDLCDYLRSFAPGLQLLPRSSSLHAMPHLPPAHHETSKRDSLNETKIKEKQNETILNSNSNIVKSITHHNQTKELTAWFHNLLLDESINNKSTKFEVQI